MLSRVADAIYWMNRYMERAENYVRFLDVNFNLSLEMPQGVTEQWKPLILATGDWELYESLYQKESKQQIIYFLGFDPQNPNSVYNSIVNARTNARMVRPEITKGVWEQINYLYYFVVEEQKKKSWKKQDPRDYFATVKEGCERLNGIFDATISRNEAYHFGKIGQYIERSDKTSRVLDVKFHMLLPQSSSVGSPLDLIQWAALLKSVSAYDMYRKKYGKLTAHHISEFLILDKEFPRSILNCLIRAERSLNAITGSNIGYSNEAEKHLGMLKSQLIYTDINDIFEQGLHEFLDDLQLKLNETSTNIFETFFSIDRAQYSQQQQ
jgi:uncharacterized alpha-E superfamily protein